MPNNDRQYYVICADNCKFESMTKEQIITAIANATGVSPEAVDVDDAFISRIKEANKNSNLKWWVGTEAEYNAIETLNDETLYIITDAADDTEALLITLQTELEQLQAMVKPTAQNAVVITDSYGDETLTGTTGTTNLIAKLQQNGVNISQYRVKPGAGFNAASGIYSFGVALGEMENDANVTEVVVIGGYNDVNNGTAETITANAASFCATAAQKFPNAKVRLYFVGKQAYNSDGVWRINYYKALQAWAKGCEGHKAEVVSGGYMCLTCAADFVNDNYHPNTSGVSKVATYIATSILSGAAITRNVSAEAQLNKKSNITALDTGVTRTGTNKPLCYQYINNDNSRIWFSKLHADVNWQPLDFDGTWLPLADLEATEEIVNGSQYNDFTAFVPCTIFAANSGFISLTAKVGIIANTLYIAFVHYDASTSDYLNDNISAIDIPFSFAIDCPTIHVMN